MGEKFRRFLFTANLVLLFAFAVWCRVTSLKTSPPPTGDEAFFGVQADHLVQGERLSGKTGSGKLVDVFYTAVEAPLHLILPPSYTVQRIPAVIFGILAVILTYVLGSKFLDRPTALIAAGLVAAMPIAIIYSRLGWEYSEVPLLCMLIIAFAARADRSRVNKIGLFLAYAACIHVSPTVLFLAPVPLGLMLVQWLKTASKSSRLGQRSLLATMVGLAGVTVCVGLRTRNSNTTQWIYETYKFGPCDWPRFLTLYMRHHLGFCQGVWTETNPMLAWCFWGLVGVVVVFGSWQLIRERAWDRLALVAGAIASAVGYHLVVGPDGFHPAMPRYGLFLVVPNALAFACLVQSLIVRPITAEIAVIRRLQVAAVFLCAWMLMLNFRYNYFAVFETQGAKFHESFWTLQTEYPDPMHKMASIVLKDLAASGKHPGPDVVVAEDWWTYKPLQLHLIRRNEIKVASLEHLVPEQKKRTLSHQLRAGGYAICAVGGPVDTTIKSLFPGDQLKQWQVQVGSHPNYAVYRLKDIGPAMTARSIEPARR
ncbi:MAG: hypothetical protein JWN86_3748 [Planctomycetota bacterium]|nr:hypothetical protein [Planctomycetota bacterium]